jgi:hypothetical protein
MRAHESILYDCLAVAVPGSSHGECCILKVRIKKDEPIPLAALSKARRAAAAGLLELGVRSPPGAWMSVSCECCVLSGRGLCVGRITRPGESYRVRS